jgi:acetyl-CoA synthetase
LQEFDIENVFDSRETIRKNVASFQVAPNVADYEHAREVFSWDDATRALDGLPGGGLNIAHECVDRHARGGRGDDVALRCIDRCSNTSAYTYRDLADTTSRFANVLQRLNVQPGDRVFILLERSFELYVAVLGTLKHRAVACTLFSAFGPEPIRQRMTIGGASVLVTTARLYERKVAGIRPMLPELDHVLIADSSDAPGTQDLRSLMENAPSCYEIGPTPPETPSLLHFTSGTTGTPKGAIHVHGAIVAHHATARSALDLHPDDVFWCAPLIPGG